MKLKTIIWTLLVTKDEFPFKNELDYPIKPLKYVSFFNNFCDAFIIGLFKIFLVMSQTPGEGTLSKVLFDVLWEKRGVSLACGRGPSE